jgi:hypothetical protein
MKTKPETTTKDIRATLAARNAAKEAQAARTSILSAFDSRADMFPHIERATVTRNAAEETEAARMKIPAPRRALAASIIGTAERIGLVAARQGCDYSGETRHVVKWGDRATASTATSSGDQYSRSCTYKKTDAAHVVTLDPAGVALLCENETLRNLSACDGLHLIALYPDDSAVWVRQKGKAIVAESGWIVGNGQVCYHSTASREAAQKGFAKKYAAHLAELREIRKSRKEERRARLIARLCGNAKATIADARALGFCTPGIKAFQEQHGIGDEAPLPALVRTGNPAATRLALNLARKLATANA